MRQTGIMSESEVKKPCEICSSLSALGGGVSDGGGVQKEPAAAYRPPPSLLDRHHLPHVVEQVALASDCREVRNLGVAFPEYKEDIVRAVMRRKHNLLKGEMACKIPTLRGRRFKPHFPDIPKAARPIHFFLQSQQGNCQSCLLAVSDPQVVDNFKLVPGTPPALS